MMSQFVRFLGYFEPDLLQKLSQLLRGVIGHALSSCFSDQPFHGRFRQYQTNHRPYLKSEV